MSFAVCNRIVIAFRLRRLHRSPVMLAFRRCLLLVVALLVAVPVARAQETPKNVILFISDGTGPATYTMARDYLRDYLHEEDGLALDGILQGSIRTYAANSRVTDSAAGATAFAAGIKSYNGAISVDTARAPVATVLEAAEQRGLATGLVATSRITHATPAAFSAHVPNRGMEAEIAAQQLDQDIDVLLGGGRTWFLPEEQEGRRDDGRDLLSEAADHGVQVVQHRDELAAVEAAPVLGLFSMSHMDYEIDRDPAEQPSLAEMTRKAIELLEDASEEGFFLMVEGSRIDHAGHSNDAAAHLHDLLAYDEAVAAALEYAREDGETLVIATSDHETGGLTLGRDGVYDWRPDVVSRVQASHGVMLDAIIDDGREPAAVLAEYAGIDSLTAAEQELLLAADVDYDLLNAALRDVVARRALIGWTTGGHTAVDVPLFGYGPGSERLVGHHDNTFVGHVIAELWDLDLEALTQALRAEQVPSQ